MKPGRKRDGPAVSVIGAANGAVAAAVDVIAGSFELIDRDCKKGGARSGRPFLFLRNSTPRVLLAAALNGNNRNRSVDFAGSKRQSGQTFDLCSQSNVADLSSSPRMTSLPGAPRRGGISQVRIRLPRRLRRDYFVRRAEQTHTLSRTASLAIYDSRGPAARGLRGLRAKTVFLVSNLFATGVELVFQTMAARAEAGGLSRRRYLSIRRRFFTRSHGKRSLRLPQ